MAGVGFGIGGTRAVLVGAPPAPVAADRRRARPVAWVEGRGGALLGVDAHGQVVRSIERPRHRQSSSVVRLLKEIVRERPSARAARHRMEVY